MNTAPSFTRTRLRTVAYAACVLALLLSAATACGADDAATKAKPTNRSQALGSIEVIEHAQANQAAYLRQLRAEHAAALRAQERLSTGFGDDRRQSAGQPDRDRRPTHHPSAHDKALPPGR